MKKIPWIFVGLRRANHNVRVQYVCFVGLRREVLRSRLWRRAIRRARMMKKNKKKDDDEVDDEQWWRAITAVCFYFEREVQQLYYEQWRNSECICFNLLTLLAGLWRGECYGQGRQLQQLSEEKDYLLRLVEKPKKWKDLFARSLV